MFRGALNVLLVHGIGDHPKEFVGEFERQLRADLQKHLNALARRYKLSTLPPADALNLIMAPDRRRSLSVLRHGLRGRVRGAARRVGSEAAPCSACGIFLSPRRGRR